MQKLNSLQAGRGIAALLVVAFHATQFASNTWHIPLNGLFKFGHSGVEFFFCLSGFIIYYAHHQDIGRPNHIKGYCLKRFWRIYPMYWLVLATALCIYHFHPIQFLVFSNRSIEILRSILLFNMSSKPVIGVAWTLKLEVTFYLVFLLLLVNASLGRIAIYLWGVAIITTAIFAKAYPDFLSYYSIGFLIGMLAAYMHLNYSGINKKPLQILLTFSLLAFLAAGVVENYANIHLNKIILSWLYNLSSATAIFAAACLEKNHKLKCPPLIVKIGNASYSIYLVHYLIICSIAFYFRSSHFYIHHYDLIFLLLFSAAIIAGIAISPVENYLMSLKNIFTYKPKHRLVYSRFL